MLAGSRWGLKLARGCMLCFEGIYLTLTRAACILRSYWMQPSLPCWEITDVHHGALFFQIGDSGFFVQLLDLMGCEYDKINNLPDCLSGCCYSYFSQVPAQILRNKLQVLNLLAQNEMVLLRFLCLFVFWVQSCMPSPIHPQHSTGVNTSTHI